MSDLLFKDIPAEGFDPNCGFIDSASDPSPARNNAESNYNAPANDRSSELQTSGNVFPGYSNDADRLSNATPSRRGASNVPTPPNGVRPSDGRDRVIDPRFSNTNSGRKEPAAEPYQRPESNNFPGYGGADRLSNAMPTRRRGGENEPPPEPYQRPESNNFPGYGGADRLSNAMPTRRRGDNSSSAPVTFDSIRQPQGNMDTSRASTPTPTRRGAHSNPFESRGVPHPSDEDARISSPTPTRRRQSGSNEPPVTFSSLGVGQPEDNCRVSSPTPTRRRSSSTFEQPPPNTGSDNISRMSCPTPTRRENGQQESRSFFNVDNNYGVSARFGPDDGRASNPTPTNRGFRSEERSAGEEDFGSDRMSNCTPSHRK